MYGNVWSFMVLLLFIALKTDFTTISFAIHDICFHLQMYLLQFICMYFIHKLKTFLFCGIGFNFVCHQVNAEINLIRETYFFSFHQCSIFKNCSSDISYVHFYFIFCRMSSTRLSRRCCLTSKPSRIRGSTCRHRSANTTRNTRRG